MEFQKLLTVGYSSRDNPARKISMKMMSEFFLFFCCLLPIAVLSLLPAPGNPGAEQRFR